MTPPGPRLGGGFTHPATTPVAAAQITSREIMNHMAEKSQAARQRVRDALAVLDAASAAIGTGVLQ